MSVQCRMVVQQHQNRRTGYTAWVQEVPPLLLCKRVHIINDNKLLVAMITKDELTLSQWLQCIMLCIHQYTVHILYKTGPDFFIVDWLSCHNHMENQDQEILGINVSILTISTSVDIPICTSIEDILIRHELIMKDDTVMKGKHIIIPCLL